jgi:hypothetical protein
MANKYNEVQVRAIVPGTPEEAEAAVKRALDLIREQCPGVKITQLEVRPSVLHVPFARLGAAMSDELKTALNGYGILNLGSLVGFSEAQFGEIVWAQVGREQEQKVVTEAKSLLTDYDLSFQKD